MKNVSISFCALLLLLLSACQKLEEFDAYNYEPERLQELLPLETGKYIIYRLDSTVFTNFGTVTEVHTYQEKNVIDAMMTDAAGRPSYRAYRFIRDAEGRMPWKANGTYVITPADGQIEVIENNLRVIKMHLPVKEGFSWKGNKYLNSNPYDPLFSFQNDNDMNTWDFHYESLNDTFTYKQQNLQVVKIVQVDNRFSLDTITVNGSQATIPKNSIAVWLRGNPTGPITINASAPEPGFDYLTIYNQTKEPATFNDIVIPSKLAFYFKYSDNKWYYPNPLKVVDNKVTFPFNEASAFIIGTATDSIKVDIARIDTFQIKNISIYNKSNQNAYANFKNALRDVSIPPGAGRRYELSEGQWRFYENANRLLNSDPYLTDLPFGTTNYSVEKYAKGIGLVFQETLMWEYQPNKGGFKNGFGVKRTLIDHN